MFELFFEGYEMQEILPCVDPLASSFKLLQMDGKKDAIVISISNEKTVILPFVDTNLDTKQVCQFDIGAKQMIKTLETLCSIKYLNFLSYLKKEQKRSFFENHSFVA